MMSRQSILALVTSLACATAWCGGACSNNAPSDQGGTTSSSGSTSSSSSSGGTGGDAGSGDAGPSDAGSDTSDCFMNPTTYYEIINACTNAQMVDAAAVLPLLGPDGGLPPLP